MKQEADERSYFALAQIEDFARAAAQLVAQGRKVYDSDPMLKLAGEAIMRRFTDAVSRLDGAFMAEYPSIRWSELTMARDISQGPGGDYDSYWDYLETRLPSDALKVTRILDAHSRRSSAGPRAH